MNGGNLMSGEAAWARNVMRAGTTTALNEGDLALAARLSRQGLDLSPDDPDLLRLLLITQLGLQEIEAAQITADRLGAMRLSPDTLDALILGAACGRPRRLRPRSRRAGRGGGRCASLVTGGRTRAHRAVSG
jgi:hypothetical protein